MLILLYIPGGFVQIGYYVRDSLLRWVEKRMGPVEQTKTVTAPPASLQRGRAARSRPSRNADGSVLATQHLTVRFGGLVAVDDVDFHADPGEVIGLIGNNGAGKSTLLNAIGGFVPSQRVGDAARTRCRARSARTSAPRLGLGRTFQAARLYPELTVRDTVRARARGPAAHVVLGLAALAAVDPRRAVQARRGR